MKPPKRTMQSRNLSKKRSYSAINLNNNRSTDDLINESFKKSISNLISTNANKFPQIKSTINKSTAPSEQPVKLRRNKSLIELKKERWARERDELKDSDSWYEKFDSLKKKPFIDRSRSQPDIQLNYDEENRLYNRFESASRLFSPVSNFDDESIALSNPYSPLSSQGNRRSVDQSPNQTTNLPLMNRSNGQSPNPSKNTNESLIQPRRSFRRYAHQFNNVNTLEKRRKQQEYQAQLEAQLADKREQNKLIKQQEMFEDRRLEAKIMNEQVELRREFELDHHKAMKEEQIKNEIGLMDRLSKGGRKVMERKKTSDLERLEMKGKELIKVFKEASTQTEHDKEVNGRPNEMRPNQQANNTISTQTNEPMINKWQSSSSILQPAILRSNRSAIRTVTNHVSKPKWTKQSNLKGKYCSCIR